AANEPCRQVRCLDDDDARAVHPPGVGSLAVVEVLADAPDGDTGREWLEIRATGSVPVDLNGLDVVVRKVETASTRSFQIEAPGCLTMVPGARWVVGSEDDGALNGAVRVDVVAPALSLFDGAALELELWWAEDLIDVARVPAGTSGVSWSLTANSDEATANDDAAAFCSSATRGIFEGVGTPGCANLCGVGCVDATGCARALRPVEPGSLLLTEVFANPTSDDAGREWVEVQVASGAPVDLNGIEIVSLRPDTGRSRRVNVEDDRCIAGEPGAIWVFAGPLAQEAGVPTTWVVGSPSSDLFYNTGASVSLWVGETCVDETPVADASAGIAYSRSAVSDDANAATWCWPTAGSPEFTGGVGTPGTENAPCP
ncbi:MAG: hypothetical protein AAB426_13370, partial [Myxococcota bacterium]